VKCPEKADIEANGDELDTFIHYIININLCNSYYAHTREMMTITMTTQLFSVYINTDTR